MRKRIQFLALLLAVQLLLAVGLFLPGTPLDRSASASGPLLGFEEASVDRIGIEGPEEAKVTLAKRDGQWQVEGDDPFPADGQRVEELLERLAKLQGGDVVGTTDGARARFKVDETSFERRITLAAGDTTLAILYGGTSPALRRLHVRVGGENEVWIAELAAHDIPVQAKDWRDTTLLAIPRPEIAAIEIDGLRIERAPRTEGTEEDADEAKPAWVATGPDDDAELDQEAADKLARALADLRFDDVLGREAKPEYGLDEPVLRLAVTRGDGESVEYRLGKAADREEYTLKVSTRPEYFRVAGWTARSLVEAAGRDALLSP